MHDISGRGYDEAKFNQLFREYIEYPVEFIYEQRLIEGKTIGVFTIAESQRRFHVVKKDFRDGSDYLLKRGEIWVRHGTSKSPPDAYDFQLFRQATNDAYEPQPTIQLYVKRRQKYPTRFDYCSLPRIYPDGYRETDAV